MSSAGGAPARDKTQGARRKARPWLLGVGLLRRRPGTRSDVSISASLAGDELEVIDSRVRTGALVTFDGWIESTQGGVTVAGRVTAPFEGTCRRCLERASGTIEADVRELCEDESEVGSRPARAGGATPGGSAADADGYLVGRDMLDLEPVVHDACILELPLAPLCSAQCRGLCPDCGANLNRETCSCRQTADPRWSALAGLSTEAIDPEPEAE
ncbi:MAG: YceD family protein [Acidimicrobiales bacterium]